MGPAIEHRLGPESFRALTTPIRGRGGRQTFPEETGVTPFFNTMAKRSDPANSWRTLETQRKNLLRLPFTNLVELALDLSPQVNKGYFDFLRYANPGYLLDNPNAGALNATQSFIRVMDGYYGSFKSHINSIWAGVFISGASFTELVLDKSGRNPVDIAVNDPLAALYERVQHPVRGYVWRLYQEPLLGQKVILEDNPLVKYIGFDRLVDKPYGRPLLGPAVYASLFLLGLIQDKRRAVANMGLSRLDYELDAEEILRLIDRNPDIAGNDEATADFIKTHINQIRDVVNNLDVDENYVHLSTVKVNYASNPMQMNMNGIDSIIDNLRNDVVNGMKSISALSNILNSTTETHITRQLEYIVSAIQSMQDELADVLRVYFDIGNQVQGRRGETRFQFKKQRTADERQAAEVEKIRTETILSKFSAELITADEARVEIQALKDDLVI